MNGKFAPILVGLLVGIALVGCTRTLALIPSLAPDVTVQCGPIADRALCLRAAELAATAKVNPPPLVDVRVRRAAFDDACAKWPVPCGDDAVIVQLQSGDTIQEVALAPSGGGWALLREPE